MWKFKKEFADANIVIPAIRLELNASNITDEKVNLILEKYPHFAHNFEKVEEEKPKKKIKAEGDVNA